MSIQNALTEWKNILGNERVFTSEQALNLYGDNTNAIKRSIAGAVIARTTEEIQKILAIANREQVALYPISTGHNWGYGTSVPVGENNVVLDLSQMNEIANFDKQLGTVSVQPGVTQKILYEFLEKHHHPFLVPLTGAGPKGSIIGNALERGFGVTPFADHFSAITTITAVLPSGDIYRSPLEEAGCTRVDRLYKYGIGPYLDGIFTQGNFGIVTEMTIALARKPETTRVFFFPIHSDVVLTNVINELPDLLSTLGSTLASIKFVNKTQIEAMNTGGKKQNDPSAQFMPEWTVTGGLFGDRRMTKVAEKIIKEQLSKHVGKIIVIDANFYDKYHYLLKYLPYSKKLKHSLETLKLTLSLFLGRPSTAALPLAYIGGGVMAHRREDLDPGKDGAGLIWFAPLIPIDGATTVTYYKRAKEIIEQHSLLPLITFTSVNDRCFDSPLPITFDKNNEDSVRQAKACYDALWNMSHELGLMPYRIPVDEMERVTLNDTPFWNMVAHIKKAIDPNNVIAPGRYGRSDF